VIDRRHFIAVVAASFVTAGRPLNAQPAGKIWRIGYIGGTPPTTPEVARIWGAFVESLRNYGYVEGRNLAIEARFVEGKSERFPAFAAELVRLKVDIIVVTSAPGVRAAMEATRQIPIVMTGTSDPVGAGLIASLARPGGNVTGVADLGLDLNAKRLELLKAIAPKAIRVAWLQSTFGGFDAARSAAMRSEVDAAAQGLGMSLLRIQMNTPQDFDSAKAAIVRERPDALLLNPNPVNLALRKEIAQFALEQRLPAMAARREEALAGILITYGLSLTDMFRDTAGYVDKIFKGADPAVLAVTQPSRFELVVNAKSAKALDIAIPQALLLRADEVIE
jgi:putative tryptophan/tyrosine transport system substrate-binding protein